jgi:hypothetical protein
LGTIMFFLKPNSTLILLNIMRTYEKLYKVMNSMLDEVINRELSNDVADPS